MYFVLVSILTNELLSLLSTGASPAFPLNISYVQREVNVFNGILSSYEKVILYLLEYRGNKNVTSADHRKLLSQDTEIYNIFLSRSVAFYRVTNFFF